MKRLYRLSIFILVLFISIYSGSNRAFSQVPPPPPPNGGPSNGHGLGGNQPAGASAPIGGGLGVFIVLGALYGGKKAYSFHKQKD